MSQSSDSIFSDGDKYNTGSTSSSLSSNWAYQSKTQNLEDWLHIERYPNFF